MTPTPRLPTFLAATAILVLTPGAATAVVIRNAIAGGRMAVLLTAVGVALGNATWSAGSCVGLSLLISRYPVALDIVKWIGGAYLAWLGAHGLWTAYRDSGRRAFGRPLDNGGGSEGVRSSPRSYVAQGNLTNLLNPAAAMFYTSYVPQFVPARQSFAPTYLALSAIHIVMAFICHCFYGFAVGGFTEAFSRPLVRTTMQAVSGAALLALAASLVFGD